MDGGLDAQVSRGGGLSQFGATLHGFSAAVSGLRCRKIRCVRKPFGGVISTWRGREGKTQKHVKLHGVNNMQMDVSVTRCDTLSQKYVHKPYMTVPASLRVVFRSGPGVAAPSTSHMLATIGHAGTLGRVNQTPSPRPMA